jgi:hypothetical protein
MAARSIQTTDQFKNTLSETDRRRIFIERMERKLAVKQALRRSQRRYLRQNWLPTRPGSQVDR